VARRSDGGGDTRRRMRCGSRAALPWSDLFSHCGRSVDSEVAQTGNRRNSGPTSPPVGTKDLRPRVPKSLLFFYVRADPGTGVRRVTAPPKGPAMAFQDRVDAGRQVMHTLGHLGNSNVLAWRDLRGRHGRWSRAPVIRRGPGTHARMGVRRASAAQRRARVRQTHLPRGPPWCHCPWYRCRVSTADGCDR
jgi:hypothetical protein